MGSKLHYWVGCKTGYVMSSSVDCHIKKPIDRLKYLGFTEDIGWPKKMNTGRILYKPNAKSHKKTRKYRKTLN